MRSGLCAAATLIVLILLVFSSCSPVGNGSYYAGSYKKRSYYKQHVKHGPSYYHTYSPRNYYYHNKYAR